MSFMYHYSVIVHKGILRPRRPLPLARGRRGREDAPGMFSGLCSGGAVDKMAFVCPIR